MTRVLHIAKAAGVSGSERHLLALLPAVALRRLEVAVVVLTAPGGVAFVDALGTVGLDVTSIPAGGDLNPVMVWRLRRQLLRYQPDIVHTHLIHADLYGQLAARVVGVPGVSSVHSAHEFYRRQPYCSAARLAGHLARRIIAISDHVAHVLAEARVVPWSRIRVVHYGIDSEGWSVADDDVAQERRSLGVAPGNIVVGIASRLVCGKGHEVLLRAFAKAARREVGLQLLIAGDGPNRPQVEAVARSEGISDRVSFLGYRDRMERFMAACDIVVFPTQPELGEGFGLAALEAMAAGKPVVATRVASLPEVVADGVSGVLVEPGDIDGLGDALVRLAVDDRLRSRLGEAGRHRALELFSLEAMVDRTVAVYEEVLGGVAE